MCHVIQLILLFSFLSSFLWSCRYGSLIFILTVPRVCVHELVLRCSACGEEIVWFYWKWQHSFVVMTAWHCGQWHVKMSSIESQLAELKGKWGWSSKSATLRNLSTPAVNQTSTLFPSCHWCEYVTFPHQSIVSLSSAALTPLRCLIVIWSHVLWSRHGLSDCRHGPELSER